MKHALVVFESMFGNTRDVADAIAEGLRTRYSVDLVEVGAAPTTLPRDMDLVVVGGPTHAFGMTRPATREDAASRSPSGIISSGTGLREWLEALVLPTVMRVAAFDTRIDKPRVPGSAAKAAAKRLRRLGAHITAPAESFYVVDVRGPLLAGELQRARAWGESLATRTDASGKRSAAASPGTR
jgi:flavorubredoxin